MKSKKEQPNHKDRGHAEFSPSSLKYVAKCPAYEGRSGTSAAAEKGTRIHEALEIFDPSALHDEEELEIYEAIVKMEKDFLSNFSAIAEEHNEIQVDVDLTGTKTFGTCDRFLILEGGKTAIMADYKTGISIIDPPHKNWQSKAYVVGAFQLFPDIDQIDFVFYVPMHDACLHSTFYRADLDRLVEELSEVIRNGERVRPKWKTGTPAFDDCNPSDNCRFCKHEDRCPALGYMAVDIKNKFTDSLSDIDPNALDDPEQLPKLFQIAKIVENWAQTVKAKAKQHMLDGDELVGLKLRSMGQSKKCSDNETLVKLAKQFGVESDMLIDEASFPLTKIAKIVAEQAPKEKRKEKMQIFLDACEDAGIVEKSPMRYSVVEAQ